MTKMLMKMTALQANDYDISFVPDDGQLTPNEISIKVEHNKNLEFTKTAY
jgi:hypothetical protein